MRSVVSISDPKCICSRGVLKQISPAAETDISSLAAAPLSVETTALVDADLANDASTAKSGILSKAWSYITVPLIDRMDMFCDATQSLRDDYSFRARELKGPREGLSNWPELTKGDWTKEFRATTQNTFFNVRRLRQLGIFEPGERGSTNAR